MIALNVRFSNKVDPPCFNQTISLTCQKYESIISIVSLVPETFSNVQDDTGCDTCYYFMDGSCAINSP